MPAKPNLTPFSSLQRWMTPDPIGFDGGSANLYQAFGNSPAMLTDPTGLTPANAPIPAGLPSGYSYSWGSNGLMATQTTTGEIFAVQYFSPEQRQRLAIATGRTAPTFLLIPVGALQSSSSAGTSSPSIPAMQAPAGPSASTYAGSPADAAAEPAGSGGWTEATAPPVPPPPEPYVPGIDYGAVSELTAVQIRMAAEALRRFNNQTLRVQIFGPNGAFWDWLAIGAAAAARFRTPPNGGAIHIDIGGEGRYPGAINVNPGMAGGRPVTMGPTQRGGAGAAGRPIPNLVQATGERLPFGNRSVDIVTLQNAPLRPATISEIARVIRPGGDIRLVGPNAPEVLAAHQQMAEAVGGRVYQTVVGNSVFTNIIVPLR